MSEKIRLQKFMSECGVASRRKSEEIIAEGKVTVNGEKAEIGCKIDPERDRVKVNGKKIERPNKFIYLMLNKPRGYISTMSDEQGRKCVAELVSDADARVYPIGRLDKDSEGMLLFTNDGEFANKMMHPSGGMTKTYRVTVRPSITEEQINKMMTGMMLDGKKTLPADIKILINEPGRVVLEITISEGRNRQIRRMCEGVGLQVARLKRISTGRLKMGMLQPGKWRRLTKAEVKLLKSDLKI